MPGNEPVPLQQRILKPERQPDLSRPKYINKDWFIYQSLIIKIGIKKKIFNKLIKKKKKKKKQKKKKKKKKKKKTYGTRWMFMDLEATANGTGIPQKLCLVSPLLKNKITMC